MRFTKFKPYVEEVIDQHAGRIGLAGSWACTASPTELRYTHKGAAKIPVIVTRKMFRVAKKSKGGVKRLAEMVATALYPEASIPHHAPTPKSFGALNALRDAFHGAWKSRAAPVPLGGWITVTPDSGAIALQVKIEFPSGRKVQQEVRPSPTVDAATVLREMIDTVAPESFKLGDDPVPIWVAGAFLSGRLVRRTNGRFDLTDPKDGRTLRANVGGRLWRCEVEVR